MKLIDRIFLRVLRRPEIVKHLARALLEQHVVFGNEDNMSVADSAVLNNTLFNVMSGRIAVGERSFFGHNVVLLTGSHNYLSVGEDRQNKIPEAGRDIIIGEGVWIATNAIVIGPCSIGNHAVVAAGAVVLDDVPPYGLAAGVPAKVVRMIEPENKKFES